MGYIDLRDFIKRLEDKGQLVRIKSRINKDTELMPLVRWQFRGLTAEKRKAFLFENVCDSNGKNYRIPVAVGLLGASRQIYATAMDCDINELHNLWKHAQLNPIEPVIVKTGPVKEKIYKGRDLEKPGCGIGELPVPISTPGFDPAPFITAPYWVTKDPETGVRNIGTYRAMIKSKTKIGVMAHQAQHIGIHLKKCKDRKIPLQAAVVIGSTPSVGLCSVARFPYGVDEYKIAGGLYGKPLELVKCETVDIEVPAYAEIVIEGEIPTDYLEPEAPFGEYTGYMGERAMNPVMNITCITQRKNPIYQAFISQFPPSESSLIKMIGHEGVLLKLLKHDCNIPSVLDVSLHEYCGTTAYCVIQLTKTNPAQPWQALNLVGVYAPTFGKVIIAVDEDIDPHDSESVNWALCFRMQPHLDTKVITGKASGLDPSSAPPDTPTDIRRFPPPSGTSALLIDATRKWDYPPVSLPAKEYMENAWKIWEREGLPELKPKVPWYGYSLGNWTEENEEEAELAVKGKHYITGKKLSKRGIKV